MNLKSWRKKGLVISSRGNALLTHSGRREENPCKGMGGGRGGGGQRGETRRQIAKKLRVGRAYCKGARHKRDGTSRRG